VSILEVLAANYHADVLGYDSPSLSSSIVHILTESTPKHAWTAHPRLNPWYEPLEDDKFDVGTAAHALMLQGEEIVSVVEAKDWRTNEAKDKRDLARKEGKVPLLAHQWENVQAMARLARTQFDQHEADPPLFTDGKPERTLVWEEDGVLCRARLDWLRDDHRAIDDLKTCRSANPEAWTRRTMFAIGADTQASFYRRGVRAVTGADAEFRFVIVEKVPPYAFSVISPGPAVLALADEKVDRAISTWRRCLAEDSWPGYPTQVCHAELPAWVESQWLEREGLAEEATA